MGDVYALLVGIDAYLPPVNALYGCRNDMAAFEQFLTARVGDRLRLATLYDAAATRAAVIDTFRAHLGQAGAGDVALFAYAGHGSEEPAPAAVVAMEPTGRIQTLMVHDCGRRVDGKLVRAIADKELAVLITEVAAKDAHTAIILDCCHSGGGTRDPESSVRGWIARPESVDAAERALVAELAAPRPDDDLLPGALDRWPAPPTPHVALAACHSFETAKEHRVGDVTRGAFSVGLVGALETLGTRTTYRSLLNTVRARVSRTAEAQVPELWPLDAGSLGDALFLDGTVTPVPATFTMSQGFDGWELDAGLVHGLRAPVGDDAFVVACTPPGGGRTPAGVARVTTVEIGRSMVEPIGWTPEDVAYAAVITEVPLPPGEVQLDEPADDLDPAVAARVRDAVRAAVASAGANGGPSPHLRVVASGDADVGALRLRVAATAAGAARIARADGTPILPDVPVADDGGARLVVSQLEHVVRWEQVRGLGDQASPLDDAIALDVFAAEEGETVRPADRTALAPAAGYTVRYEPAGDGGWTEPRIFVELRNTTGEHLFVAVLDLTDRFRCSALLHTGRVAPGQTVALNDGAPMAVTLPQGRPVIEGALARDWLKVVVSDVEFDASAFDLPALGERPPQAVATRSLRSWGTLERLAAKAISRDVTSGRAPVAARWAATTVLLESVVGN